MIWLPSTVIFQSTPQPCSQTPTLFVCRFISFNTTSRAPDFPALSWFSAIFNGRYYYFEFNRIEFSLLVRVIFESAKQAFSQTPVFSMWAFIAFKMVSIPPNSPHFETFSSKIAKEKIAEWCLNCFFLNTLFVCEPWKSQAPLPADLGIANLRVHCLQYGLDDFDIVCIDFFIAFEKDQSTANRCERKCV